MPTVPFLIAFARKCVSPGRASTNADFEYDRVEDMVRWAAAPGAPFAIDLRGSIGPVTKKADIEKGEDNKDRRMWR